MTSIIIHYEFEGTTYWEICFKSDRVSFGIYSSHTVYGTKSEIITRHRTPPIQEFEDCVRFIHSDLFIAIHKICDQSIHYIVLSGQRGCHQNITVKSRCRENKDFIIKQLRCGDVHNHNCLMILAQYKYYHILLFILNNQKDEEYNIFC
eukprot:648388_1